MFSPDRDFNFFILWESVKHYYLSGVISIVAGYRAPCRPSLFLLSSELDAQTARPQHPALSGAGSIK
jgi:hypothetical protein